jgi:hypothetical protein
LRPVAQGRIDLVTDRRAAAAPRAQTGEAAPLSLWIMATLALLPLPISAGVYGYGPPAIAREAVSVLLTWSAVVLSFLAGVRWGLETSRRSPRHERLALSLLFAVVAWALLLARWRFDLRLTFTAYLVAFLLQWLTDHLAPDSATRYPRLSTAVTASAGISLAIALDQAMRG